ncbi:unnamed protein product [Rotaria sp. Silwood2]|nr:unnamed protein product [Rotaria sp. Silwood2]
MMRKLAPTGIVAAEIDGMTIHSFLGEQHNSGKARTIKPGNSKLEKEWALVEYLLIDEMSMVGLTLLAKLNRIICAGKHADPQIPFGGVNVIFFGDYLQYRPVYDVPLHTDFSLPAKTGSIEEKINQKGRPPNERFLFQKQHPQATTYLMMKYSESHVPVLYGPQIPRQDRDDTRERYCRAILTLFVSWRTVTDICDISQTWEDAFKSRQHLILSNSWTIIENIQLLHECKKDRDDHLLQVIAEAQTDNGLVDPVLIPTNQVDGEYGIDDSDDLLELLGNLDENTVAMSNATKNSTENRYIEETIEAVKNVGRFNSVNSKYYLNVICRIDSNRKKFVAAYDQYSLNASNDRIDQSLIPFISATPNLVRLNTKWQEQLKTEKEQIRRGLITGNFDKDNDVMLNLDTARSAVASVVTLNNINTKTYENYGSIPPVISVKTNSCIQKSVADEFTLNREQRAVFMIITGHLDGDSLCRTGNLYKSSRHILKYIIFSGDNNGQLIMCIPGCGGTGKSQLIPPTGIAAAEIDDITIHSFLGEQRNPGKARTIKPGDLKLEKEWALVEYLLIDEISMVGLTLLAKLNRIICAAKHTDPQVPFGGVNVIFFGDYLQYRPVYDVPLHTDFTLPVKSKSNKTPTEKQIQQRVARSLILQINCVVKLTQQMRTEDLRYLQLLERLRHGERNYDDYELLLTRVVGQSSVPLLSDSPWNKAPILVFRNEVRTQLNHKAVSHKAEQMGQAPIVCVAQDTCKGKPIEDRALIKKFLELSDSKTEHLPGLLPLVPGTPVILTQNIAIELGLINVQTQLSHKVVSHKAEQVRQTPIVCVAQDTCKGKPIEDRALIKKLLELSDSKTEHLSGLLPLVPGMPVILTQNIAIELGLINGVNGIFRQLVYQDDSVSTDIISEEFSNNARYVHRPLYTLVEINKSKIECNLEQLLPKLIPIPVMEQTFRVDIGDMLPKDKKPKSNRKTVLSIKRRALLLVPAYCTTTYKI